MPKKTSNVVLWIGSDLPIELTMSAIVKANNLNVDDGIRQQKVGKCVCEWVRESVHKGRNDRISNPCDFFSYPYIPHIVWEKLKKLRVCLHFLLTHHMRIITWVMNINYLLQCSKRYIRTAHKCACPTELMIEKRRSYRKTKDSKKNGTNKFPV